MNHFLFFFFDVRLARLHFRWEEQILRLVCHVLYDRFSVLTLRVRFLVIIVVHVIHMITLQTVNDFLLECLDLAHVLVHVVFVLERHFRTEGLRPLQRRRLIMYPYALLVLQLLLAGQVVHGALVVFTSMFYT